MSRASGISGSAAKLTKRLRISSKVLALDDFPLLFIFVLPCFFINQAASDVEFIRRI